MPDEGQELLTRAEAAAALGVGERQLHNLADSGQLPRLRNRRGHVRFDPADVARLARDREEFRRAS